MATRGKRLGNTWVWLKTELFEFRIVVPIYVTLLLTQVIFLESLAFVGHYVRRDNSTFQRNNFTHMLPDDTVKYNDAADHHITGISVIYGLSTAVDTHCSQAFGNKNYKRVGVVFQRGLIIIGILILPIFALWLNMQSILTLLQQDPAVVKLTALYLRIFCLALPSIFVVIMLAKYLQSQSIIFVFILVGFISNVINIVLHAGLLIGAKLGFLGAIISMTISQGISPVLVLIYMFACGLHKQTWGGWTWEALEDWWPFIKLAIPGLLMIGLEWWSYEIGGFVLGTIDKTQQAIHLNLLNINAILFLSALAIGITGSIRVGQALGAGKGQEAKRVFYLVFVITLVESVIFGAILQGVKNVVGEVFSEERSVIEGMAKVINILSPFLVCDHMQNVQACTSISSSLQGALGGVLRGSGRHFIGAIVNFVSFYCIGLPIGISLALVTCRGAEGLWIGLFCGAFVETIAFIIILMCTNWEKEAAKAIFSSKAVSPTHEYKYVINQNQDIDDGNRTTKYKLMSESVESLTQLPPVGNVTEIPSDTKEHTPQRKSRFKLLLLRSPVLLVAIVILIIGLVVIKFEYKSTRAEYRASAHCRNSSNSF
eukprot:Em0008g516a